MELIDLLQVVRRWFWLIVAVVIVTELALWLGTRSAEPVYAASVKLQISTPQSADVAAYDEYRSISLRDEITVAINNFLELLQSDEVRERTISQLGLEGKDGHYTLHAEHVQDADFVNVTVEARTPSLAAEIANTHVKIAIAYYGELRAKSTNAEKELFAEQLRVAEEEFQAAEDAFAAFQAQHGITSLENELDKYKQLLAQLGLERDQRLLKELTTTADPVAEVDKLIAQRQKEMERLLSLAPTYNLLEADIQQARDRYSLLSQGPNANDITIAKNNLEKAAIALQKAQSDYDKISWRNDVGMTSQATALQQATLDYQSAQATYNKATQSSATALDLEAARTNLLTAEKALADFQTQNGIFSLDSQLSTQQKLLEQLQLERDRRQLEETTTVIDPVGEVDKLIAQRQKELDQLTALAPQYNILAQKVEQAREAYQHLLGKYSEAELKVTAVQAANFIQVIKPAYAPAGSESNWPKLAVLALAGSLGVGVMLAFLLQYISSFKTAGVTVAESEQKPPAHERAGRVPSAEFDSGGGTYSCAR
jgi:uncharacterized protein involved in exopolysaccharide biosynthesis